MICIEKKNSRVKFYVGVFSQETEYQVAIICSQTKYIYSNAEFITQ